MKKLARGTGGRPASSPEGVRAWLSGQKKDDDLKKVYRETTFKTAQDMVMKLFK